MSTSNGIGGAASGAAAGTMIGGPGWGTGIGAGIGLLGGLLSGGDSSDEQNALAQQAMDEIKNLPTPALQQVALEKYRSAGILTPQLEQTYLQKNSELNNIKTDPRLKDAQMGALNSLLQRGQGGLQASDIAAFNQSRRQADADAEARSQQTLQDMQARGQGGSGAELAARLSQGQASANRLATSGDNISTTASQNALQSLMNAGNLGGSIRGQDYNQQAQAAQAQDAINRFNTANQQTIAGQNVNRTNSARQYNLSNDQDILNRNTGVANENIKYNQGLLQQDYTNRLSKAQGIYGADRQGVNDLRYGDQQSNQKFAGIMGGAVNAAGSYAGYQQGNNYLDILRKKYGQGSDDSPAPAPSSSGSGGYNLGVDTNFNLGNPTN